MCCQIWKCNKRVLFFKTLTAQEKVFKLIQYLQWHTSVEILQKICNNKAYLNWLKFNRRRINSLTLLASCTKNKTRSRSSRWQIFIKVGVLKNVAIFTGKHLCWNLFLIKMQAWRSLLVKKKTPTQVFPFEYCKIFKTTFFYRIPTMAAFGIHLLE